MINKIAKILLILIIAVCFSAPSKINAATLYISPSSTSVSVGNIITVKALVNTLGQSINNAEATIQFPTDMLDVISVTKSSSIFSLWVEEPSFSNSAGKITFNGGIPSPGWSGSSGYIVSITFKAKRKGTASILFTDGAIRKNDGLGTDILTGKFGSIIQIKSTEAIENPKKTEEIISTNTKNITSINIFTPSIRFEGNQGIVKLSNKETITNIDYYTLAIDDNPTFKVKKEQLINYEYYLPILTEGNHSITIISFVMDGKYTESILDFIAPSISLPILSLNTSEIIKGDFVIISGKTDYSSTKVNVILELNNKEIRRYEQTTGNDGSFSVTTDSIKEVGNINIWAEVILSDLIKSQPSEIMYLKVNEPNVIRISLAIFYPFLWLIVIFAIISLLLFFLYLGWHKFFGLRKRFENKTKLSAIEVHKAMLLLKDELGNQLERLENVKKDRNLNQKEEAIFNEIEKNIDGVDTFIEKKLKKIL